MSWNGGGGGCLPDLAGIVSILVFLEVPCGVCTWSVLCQWGVQFAQRRVHVLLFLCVLVPASLCPCETERRERMALLVAVSIRACDCGLKETTCRKSLGAQQHV